MTTTNRKDADTLNLVQCGEYYFPTTRKDLLILRANNITTARIPERTLPSFRDLFLKGVKVEEKTWEALKDSLFDHFEKTLKSVLSDIRVKMKDGAIVVFLPWEYGESAEDQVVAEMMARSKKTADQDATQSAPANDNEKNQATLFKHIEQLRRYLGQYCHSLTQAQQDQPHNGMRAFKLTYRFNPDINNALFYEPTPLAPSVQTLDLGSDFHIKFAVEHVTGKKVLSVYTEDRMNGEWIPTVRRTFHNSQISRDNVGQLIDFFITHFI